MESTYVFIDPFFCPRQDVSWSYTVSPFRTGGYVTYIGFLIVRETGALYRMAEENLASDRLDFLLCHSQHMISHWVLPLCEVMYFLKMPST